MSRTTHTAAHAVGTVLSARRGRLPYALLDGRPLVERATAEVRRAGVDLVEPDHDWSALQAMRLPVVLHDALCPLTPCAFLRDAVAAATGRTVAVAVRPVTDTIKTATHERLGRTVDRDLLFTVTSPVVLPPPVVADLDDWPAADHLASLVEDLRGRFPVRFVEAPPLGRRVEDESELAVLEAFAADDLTRRS